VTQATELGTVYTPTQLKAISKVARKYHLKIHMDGARFANAIAQLRVTPKEITWKVGVDILSFGCTKNGAPVGDAVVFFNRDLAHEFEWRCKQSGQLASKMRYIAAPWVNLLRDGAWLRHSEHANKMAGRLARGIKSIKGTKLLYPRQSNGVFVELPIPVIEALHDRGWHFYTFIGENGARLMCSWDTTTEDVDDFVADLTELMSGCNKLSSGNKGKKRKSH
jgi:threonine aldolase